MTFNTFCTGESNIFAVSACKDFCTDPEKSTKILWVYGKTGCGKTHLLSAACSEMEPTLYMHVTTEGLVRNCVASLEGKPSMWKFYDKAEILVVEELEDLVYRHATQEVVAEKLMAKIKRGQRVILSSNCPPSKIKPLFKVVKESGYNTVIVEMKLPEKALRRSFVGKYLELRPFDITQDAIEYLVRKARTIPEIMGILKTAEFFNRQGTVIDKDWIAERKNF